MTRRYESNVTAWGADGCDLHPACLTCPLPACRFEMPPGKARSYMLALRLRPLLETGMAEAELMAALGISRRHLYRIKKLVRELA